eukprot:tig00000147_g9501.t1
MSRKPFTCFTDGQCGRNGGKAFLNAAVDDQAFYNTCGKAGAKSVLTQYPGPPDATSPSCKPIVKLTSTRWFHNGLRVWQLDSESDAVSLGELESALASGPAGAEQEEAEADLAMGGLQLAAVADPADQALDLGADAGEALSCADGELPSLL